MLWSEGWVLGCKTERKRTVSSRGFSGRTESTRVGLELHLTSVKRRSLESLVAVVEEEEKWGFSSPWWPFYRWRSEWKRVGSLRQANASLVVTWSGGDETGHQVV
jgi:hypothetical protein